MGWIVIIVLGVAVAAGIAAKLFISNRSGADISQAQLQEQSITSLIALMMAIGT